MIEKENKPQASPSASGGGLTSVAHDTTLTGDGTLGNPLGVVGGTGGLLIPSNEIYINIHDPEVIGKQYHSFTNAIAWINANTTPSIYNAYALRFNGFITENVIFPPWVYPVGDGELSSGIQGSVKFLGDGSSVENQAYNCAIGSLDIDNSGLPGVPVMATTTQDDPAYTPSFFTIIFNSLVISGTWKLGIDTHTYTFNWNDDNTVIQTAINADYPLATVQLPVPSDNNITAPWCFRIQFFGETANFFVSAIASSIDLLDPSSNPSSITYSFESGQTQVEDISFSDIPSAGMYQLQAVPLLMYQH